MNTSKLAYKIYGWRKKYGIESTPQHDWKVAEYILKIGEKLPVEADWRGWERVFRYHII